MTWARTLVPTRESRISAILDLLHMRLAPEQILEQLAVNPEGARRELISHLGTVLRQRGEVLSAGEVRDLESAVLDEVIGYGPLQRLIDDPTCQEIMVNNPFDVFVERSGRLERADVRFRDARHVLEILRRIVDPVGRRIDLSSPAVNARLPNGSRVHAIIDPLAVGGPVITIRKFRSQGYSLAELVELESLSSQAATLLRACVRARLNLVVSGSTGSGKTTLLNALSAEIPDDERLITIEDSVELQVVQSNKARLEARPPNQEGVGEYSIRLLVAEALRMRPDRIIVGECRKGEAFDMLQAMNTGHAGSMTTVHANNASNAMLRLESMVLMAQLDLPLRAIQRLISEAVKIVIHLERASNGGRRVVSICEMLGVEDDKIRLQEIYGTGGNPDAPLEYTGIRPHFLNDTHD
jgi:pilus assembly protein CpaF